jgi:hypothetical protein
MNQGLGFFFFVLSPLFGMWPVGFVVGLVIVGLRHALLRKLPPDYLYYLVNGAAFSAAMIEVGVLLIRLHGRDIDACMRYARIYGLLSAVAWIPSAGLAGLSRLRRVRKWTLASTLLACLILSFIFRPPSNLSDEEVLAAPRVEPFSQGDQRRQWGDTSTSTSAQSQPRTMGVPGRPDRW